MSKPLALTELVLRDAHQSLLATRMRIEDMLPIAEKLDKAGFWSVESWGGATSVSYTHLTLPTKRIV